MESGVNTSNGDIAINIEMERMSGQSFLELKSLLKKTRREYEDISLHLQNISDLLEKDGQKICETNLKGENIFHLIANQPEKNPEILRVFGLCNEKETEGLHKYLSIQKMGELLHMSWGTKERCPIHLAVRNGFTPFVVEMLKLCPVITSALDGDLNTPLHIAAQSTMPESVECIKKLLETMTVNPLGDGENLMCARNAEGKTPIHMLCTKVPNNRNAEVKVKLETILQQNCSNDILKYADLSGKTPLHILCSEDQQYKETEHDRLNNACDLLQVFIKRTDLVNLLTTNADKRTPLHLLALSKSPKLMRILVSQTATDVTIKDAYGKMPIHYAAGNALNAKSQQCIKILANWKFVQKNLTANCRGGEINDHFRNYILWETFKEKDESGLETEGTALTAACRSKSTKTVEFLLRNVHKAKSNFGVWFMGKDNENEDVFSLKQAYKYTPAALEFLFDESLRLNMEKSNERTVEFVTNISVITALRRPIQEESAISEMKYLGYANNWPEATQEKLLLHPLTQCTLDAMWETMFCYKICWFIFNVIWLAAYWTLVPLKYSNKEGKYEQRDAVAAWILGVLLVLQAIDELLSGRACLNRLIAPEITSKMIWIQTVLTATCIYGPCLESVGLLTTNPPGYLEKYSASAGVLTSSILFWRNIAIIYLPLGIYVEYLIQTLKRILLAIICIIAVIIGFQKAFCQILPQYFSSAVWAFSKTLVMMTGEFEFTDMYKNDDEDNPVNSTLVTNGEHDFSLDWKGSINLLIFILFLIILPITFYNMITGVVVEKIVNMESKLEMYRTLNQIRLINYLQRSIVSKLDCIGHFFQCLQPCFLSYKRTETGEVVVRNEVEWYVEKDADPSFTSFVRHSFGKLCLFGGFADDASKSCGNFLSKRVRDNFFQKYEKEIETMQINSDDNNDDSATYYN